MNFLLSSFHFRPVTPMILDQNYVNLKNQVIKAERRVLKELGFCVHVKHPHKLIVVYLQYLGFSEEVELLQQAWNFMNDSFRSDVFVRYQPETIACACIALAGRKLNINMSTSPPWFVIFNVKEEDLIDACFRIHGLYLRPKADVEKLEEAVNELKKKYQDQRKKEQSNVSSPATTIVDRSNGAGHNMWGGFIQRQVPSTNVNTNSDEKTDNGSKKYDGKLVNSTNTNNNNNNNNNESKGRSKSRSRSRNSRSKSRSRSSERHSKKKKRTRSRSRSSDSDYDRKNRKR
jgi:cyclin L